MKKTINQYLKSFTAAWGSSVTARIKAAKLYAAACNTKNTEAKAQFWQLPGFEEWTEAQWSALYYIGNSAMSPVFLDVKEPCVPITMVTHHLSVETQEDIYTNGLTVATIIGGTKHISYKYIQSKHIDLAFKPCGAPRTHEEQVKWLKDHERPNWVIIPGALRVNHACFISSEELFRILDSDDSLLGVEALQALITRKTRRS